jgi:hypothetical protein
MSDVLIPADPDHFPPELRDSELDLIDARRPLHLKDQPAVGLALSGGGIRSATLSLGFLQALAEIGALERIDYVSTVSGGGYTGTLLGGLFQPREEPATEAKKEAAEVRKDVEKELTDPSSFTLRWLRENGRYIAPNGASDLWVAFAAVLRNFFAMLTVFATLGITAFLLAEALRVGVRVWIAPLLSVPGSREVLIGHGVWWSPWILVPAAVLVCSCAPAAAAFWLIRPDREDGVGVPGVPPWITTLGVLALGAAYAYWSAVLALAAPKEAAHEFWWRFAGGMVVVIVALLTLVIWGVATRLGKASSADARNMVTGWLRTGLITLVATLAFSFIDTAGQTVYARVASGQEGWALLGSGATTLSFGGLAAASQKFLAFIGGDKQKRFPIPLAAVAFVAAAVVVGFLLTGFSVGAHALAWAGEEPLSKQRNLPVLFSSLAVGILLTVAFGRARAFLTRSSLAGLYAARLTRTFLGASNRRRRRTINQNVTRLLPGDTIDHVHYEPHRFGGPLHIINTTLNETVTGQSQVEQRDRHGMNMAVGPVGVSVGARHHAAWQIDQEKRTGRLTPVSTAQADQGAIEPPFRVFDGTKPYESEPLDVGQWMAVSGAAVSPGLGWRTSVSFSLLLGLLNVRLGRWWFSGVDPKLRKGPVPASAVANPGAAADYENRLRMLGRTFSRGLPVYAHLLDELLARFHGPQRRFWYLTDGGHFENTGAYELIRRRVPIVLLCDNGADGDGSFSDAADLVRKARVDFNTEIEFLSEEELHGIGAHQSLKRFLVKVGTVADIGFQGADDCSSRLSPVAATGRCAFGSLAWIRYPNSPPGLLLLVKPRVTGELSLDVREYKKMNPGFPQQSTADQFFDERQWESHRKLGQEIGRALFPEPIGEEQSFWPAGIVRMKWATLA